MKTHIKESDFVRNTRVRRSTEGDVFWVRDDELMVLDADVAQRVHALNFAELTLPDRLVDLLRRRKSIAVSWTEVRTAWLAQLQRMSDSDGIRRIEERMTALLDVRVGRPLDLVWAMQDVVTQSLIPTVVAALRPSDLAHIVRDQTMKLRRLMAPAHQRETLLGLTRSTWVQIAAGWVVRRELRDRARGRRPRQLDLTDPVVDMLPRLGMDRAVDAVTTVLTAIAGPPGAVAACLAYELTRRSDWCARLGEELVGLTPEEFYAAPARVAPLTHRFVKETLRVWSPPLFLTRSVRTDIEADGVHIKEGQHYHASTYFIHHDAHHWRDAETFDPDRWRPGAAHGPCSGAAYVPFGWSPTACIGANLGTIQLMVLCRLLCTRYRVDVSDPDAVHVFLGSVPVPVDFRGSLARRVATGETRA